MATRVKLLAFSLLLVSLYIVSAFGKESESPQREYITCQLRCGQSQQQEPQQQLRCQQRCIKQLMERGEQEHERERERGRGDRGDENQITEREQEERHNPYYFQEQRFQSRFRSDQGHIRVLERFSDRSELLKGLKNYRLAILEANPQTFIVPHHLDAECVLVVVRGKATITSVWQDKKEIRKESHNLERGDVISVPTGTTTYLVNHGNENLQIVRLVQPVNNPSEFKEFIPAGGENQGYYNVFSNEVLEAALNIPSEQLERTLRKHGERQVAIVKASEEQIRALSQRATSTRRGRGSRGPIKLESQSPIYKNQFGQMYEFCPDEFPQLQKPDIAAAVVDIKQGGMMMPHFNSRATWVVFVAEGTGSFEMACPHLHGGERRERERYGRREEEEEEEEREERSGEFQRVTGRLTRGGVLVIPAGHPIAVMANQNENLRLIGLGINAENNRRNFLAGKENIMNEIEREAKELAFNIEGKEAEEIFKRQKESVFTQSPEAGRRRSTAFV